MPSAARPPLCAAAALRPRKLDEAVYEVAEQICDLAARVLDLESDRANSTSSAESLSCSAILLAAAARTLLSRERAPVPSGGDEPTARQESHRFRRSRQRALRFWRGQDGVDLPATVNVSAGVPLPPGRVNVSEECRCLRVEEVFGLFRPIH